MCAICGRSHDGRTCPVVLAVAEVVKMMRHRRAEGLCPCCGREPQLAELIEDPGAWRKYEVEGTCRGCQGSMTGRIKARKVLG